MDIHYLDCDGKAKLFSFYRHDYQSVEIDNKRYVIDGGFDYVRKSTDGELKKEDVKNLIGDIRECFTWIQNLDKNNHRITPITHVLKDLSSSHICSILSNLTNKLYDKLDNQGQIDIQQIIIHEIFIQELNYRIENNLI